MNTKNYLEIIKDISVRGRMAYLLCSLEKLLLHYSCDKKKWSWILEKFWAYTSIQYLDNWMYEIAEYMPNSIFEDTMDDVEFITESEYIELKKLYRSVSDDVCKMIQIIFELGTCDLYSKLLDNSPNTLLKTEEGICILKNCNITLVDVNKFKKFKYTECDGWGDRFDGKELSVFL